MARRARSLEAAFGDALREFRARAGLSQEALGLRSDLHPTYISQLERGLKSPSLRAIHALAATLGVHAHAIVKRAEDLMG